MGGTWVGWGHSKTTGEVIFLPYLAILTPFLSLWWVSGKLLWSPRTGSFKENDHLALQAASMWLHAAQPFCRASQTTEKARLWPL